MNPVRRNLALESGPSLDGVDCVVCACRGRRDLQVEHHGFLPFPPSLRVPVVSISRAGALASTLPRLH